MSMVNCSECGMRFNKKIHSCPRCGWPVELSVNGVNKSKRGIVIRVIIGAAVILIAAIVLGLYTYIQNLDRSGYYNDCKWGMSFDEVAEQLDLELDDYDGTDFIYTYEENYNFKSDVNKRTEYWFEDDALNLIEIKIENDSVGYSNSSLLDEYKRKLDFLFGEQKNVSEPYVWVTEKSIIILKYMEDDGISIIYHSKYD